MYNFGSWSDWADHFLECPWADTWQLYFVNCLLYKQGTLGLGSSDIILTTVSHYCTGHLCEWIWYLAVLKFIAGSSVGLYCPGGVGYCMPAAEIHMCTTLSWKDANYMNTIAKQSIKYLLKAGICFVLVWHMEIVLYGCCFLLNSFLTDKEYVMCIYTHYQKYMYVFLTVPRWVGSCTYILSYHQTCSVSMHASLITQYGL